MRQGTCRFCRQEQHGAASCDWCCHQLAKLFLPQVPGRDKWLVAEHRQSWIIACIAYLCSVANPRLTSVGTKDICWWSHSVLDLICWGSANTQNHKTSSEPQRCLTSMHQALHAQGMRHELCCKEGEGQQRGCTLPWEARVFWEKNHIGAFLVNPILLWAEMKNVQHSIKAFSMFHAIWESQFHISFCLWSELTGGHFP